MKKILILIVLFLPFVLSGCQGLASLGTPTSYEQKIPAEFNLSEYKTNKILILVKSSSIADNQDKVSLYLNKSIGAMLLSNKAVKPEQLIPFSELEKYRNSEFLFDIKKPVEVGKALNADLVLTAEIIDLKLENLGGTDFYEGSLTVRASIADIASSQVLWTADGSGKLVKVGFDVENSGLEAAAKRLAVSASHCITRYLYDCRKASFKIYEEAAQGW
jgi:hypothetical protein